MKELFKRFGLTRIFDDDGGDDANNANAGGGDDDKTKAGAGGSDDKNKAAPKGESFEITVDGEKRQLTREEMINLAQKASGADKKFQDASKLKKDAGDAMRKVELIERLKDSDQEPSENDIREVASWLGIDPKEFADYLADDDDDDKGKNKQGTGEISPEALAKALGMNPAEAKQILEFSHQRHIDDAKKEIRRISDEAVDKDEIFGKIKIGEKAEDRLAVIKDMVAEDVLTKIQNGEPFGAELVAASVQKVRAYLTKFGIPGKPEQYPVTLGLGPSGGLPAEVNSEEPIPRKKVGEQGQDDNFAARWMQKGLKKIREAGGRRQ